ncbi:MAG: hypothetical protein NC915_01700 [Candidatus Omnitrophica bacterium]|nr:hypothetical protein [Candidatus Omnitrophota bacterium]
MKKNFLLIILLFPLFTFPNGKLPKEDIIYNEIKKTFSNISEEIVKGIYTIGEKKIEKAIPFILRLLNDETITWIQYNGEGKWTRIDKEVEEALVKIGEPSLKYLSKLLVKKEYPYVLVEEKTQTKIVSIVSRITGKIFKTTTECINFLKGIE